jgi:hypothetical protein
MPSGVGHREVEAEQEDIGHPQDAEVHREEIESEERPGGLDEPPDPGEFQREDHDGDEPGRGAVSGHRCQFNLLPKNEPTPISSTRSRATVSVSMPKPLLRKDH